MSSLTSRYACGLFALFILLMGFAAPAVQAGPILTIFAGYNLLNTQPGTSLAGVPMEGVPLGDFNFGGSVGIQSAGDADTIVQRLSNASTTSLPGSGAPISIQLDALQMVTPAPVNLGAGVNFYYLTLQSTHGGPLSTGQMTVEFNHPDSGTFTSFFDLFYDIRVGSLNGPIFASSDVTLTNSSDAWQSAPPDANDVVINGVNSMLNGVGTTQDFWPIGNITQSGGGATDVARNAELLPEPGSLLMVAVAGLALWRRSH